MPADVMRKREPPSATTVPAGVSTCVPAARLPSASVKPVSCRRRASPVVPASTPTRTSLASSACVASRAASSLRTSSDCSKAMCGRVNRTTVSPSLLRVRLSRIVMPPPTTSYSLAERSQMSGQVVIGWRENDSPAPSKASSAESRAASKPRCMAKPAESGSSSAL